MTTEKRAILIGQVLDFNERGHVHSEISFNKKVKPALLKLADAWKALPFAVTFTQEVLDDLNAYGLKNTRAQYQEQVKKEMKSFKTPFLQELAMAKIEEELAPLQAALDAFHSTMSEQNASSESYVLLEEISIQEECPVLNLEAVKRRYETRIDTGQQAELYSLMLAVKEAHHALKGYLIDRGYDLTRRSIVGDPYRGGGLMYEEPKTGDLIIDPQSINAL